MEVVDTLNASGLRTDCAMYLATILDTTIIDQPTIDEYERNGVVVIRQLFTPEEVRKVAAGIEKVLAAPGPLAGIASEADDPGKFFEDFCNWQRISEYEEIAFVSKAADVAGQLMGANVVRLNHDHTLVKEPGTKAVTPWHQDQPYYNFDGWQGTSMWMPVDPVAIESTLEFLAGSHLMGWLMPRTFKDNQAKWFPEGSLNDLPDIEADRAAFDIKGWELTPGDVVFFHMLTAHHSYGVPGKNRRRAFSLRFTGDDVVHTPRPWRTSPQFDGLEAELPAGAPLDHPLFPVVRTRA